MSTATEFRPSDNHWNLGDHVGYRERVTKAQLRDLLLNQPSIALKAGKSYDWKSRHVGAGIYEIWLKERP